MLVTNGIVINCHFSILLVTPALVISIHAMRSNFVIMHLLHEL